MILYKRDRCDRYFAFSKKSSLSIDHLCKDGRRRIDDLSINGLGNACCIGCAWNTNIFSLYFHTAVEIKRGPDDDTEPYLSKYLKPPCQSIFVSFLIGYTLLFRQSLCS